ncbi:MAG: TadE/TadG family type IV pilus assembly protein [Myxococcota bacterium]
MLTRFWKATREEDGQAIVIAAIGLLVVAMVVLATATLGNAIHEKMRLQNAADAAAYSTAAVEARAFNFYAFTNRTMVSHYVAIMLLQSYLVVATFIYSALNTILSIVSILGAPCNSSKFCATAVCTALKLVPYVGYFLSVFIQIMAAIENVLRPIADALKLILWGEGMFRGLDWLVGWLAIPAFVAANWVLYLAQVAMMMGTTTFVVSGGYRQVVDKAYEGTGRDPPVPGAFGVPAAGFNEFHWARAHDPDAYNMVPVGHPDRLMGFAGRWKTSDWLADDMKDVPQGVQRAQRIMTEISNGTRWSPFVFNRSLEGSMIGSVIDMISNATLGIFDLAIEGETKMLTESWPPHDVRLKESYERHDIRRNTTLAGHTYMPQGGSVVGDQWLEMSFFRGVGKYNMTQSELKVGSFLSLKRTPGARQSAVAATHREYSPDGRWGWHCSTHLRTEELGIMGCKFHVHLVDKEASACDAEEPNEAQHGNHPWWGVTPFMKFNPDSDPSAGSDFHQPSTFVWLHQTPENIDQEPLMQQMFFSQAGHEVELDTSTEGEGEVAEILGSGFHAMSRGLVYYHRPGNWNEHPNFFNPFWRAKLEPVAPVLNDLANDFGMGVLGDLLGRRIITH